MSFADRLLRVLAPLLVVLVLVQPARADIARQVHERRLANGLRVVVSPIPSAADVSILVRYDVGSRDEPNGLEGLAHLVEHLMFTGSKHAPRGKHAELLDQAGAVNVNAATIEDATAYFETLPPERLELGLWLESDRMGYLLDRADEAAFEQARAQVANEHRQRVIEAGLGNVPAFLRAELFPAWHPYDHTPSGTAASLRALTYSDARAFVSTWYGPANAILVIAGKVDPPAAMALAERYFKSLPARPPPQRPALPAIPRHATRSLFVAASVMHANVELAWISPPGGAPGDAELEIAAALLAGRGAGWLDRLLLDPPHLCTRVAASQSSMAAASIFRVRATVSEGRSPREVLDTIHHVMGRFEHAIGDAELSRAKAAVYNEELVRLESTLYWAGLLAREAARGPLPGTFDGQLSRYAAIGLDGIRRAVREHLGPMPTAFVLSVPRTGFPVAGNLLDTRAWPPR